MSVTSKPENNELYKFNGKAIYRSPTFDTPKPVHCIARYLNKQGSSQSLDTGFGLNEDLKYVQVIQVITLFIKLSIQ